MYVYIYIYTHMYMYRYTCIILHIHIRWLCVSLLDGTSLLIASCCNCCCYCEDGYLAICTRSIHRCCSDASSSGC